MKAHGTWDTTPSSRWAPTPIRARFRSAAGAATKSTTSVVMTIVGVSALRVTELAHRTADLRSHFGLPPIPEPVESAGVRQPCPEWVGGGTAVATSAH